MTGISSSARAATGAPRAERLRPVPQRAELLRLHQRRVDGHRVHRGHQLPDAEPRYERLGVKLSPKSERTKLSKNDLFGNLVMSRTVPADNYSFDPKFASPRARLDFKVASNEPCCMYGSDNKILGSRMLGGSEKQQGAM